MNRWLTTFGESITCWWIEQTHEQMVVADDLFMKQESSRGSKAQMKHSDNQSLQDRTW